MEKKCSFPLMPNTTSVPNFLFDEWMCKLTDVQFKVLMVICRKTFGWRKEFDRISNSQICKLTGFTTRPVREAVKFLAENHLIIKQAGKRANNGPDFNTYSLNVFMEVSEEKSEEKSPENDPTPLRLPAAVPSGCQQPPQRLNQCQKPLVAKALTLRHCFLHPQREALKRLRPR